MQNTSSILSECLLHIRMHEIEGPWYTNECVDVRKARERKLGIFWFGARLYPTRLIRDVWQNRCNKLISIPNLGFVNRMG